MKNAADCMEYQIRLAPDEVNRFVNAATKCDFDVDIFYNSFVVDAKSIVGVLGLDFRNSMTVVCHGFNQDFDSYLSGLGRSSGFEERSFVRNAASAVEPERK